ncbi:hypothetical protein L5515_009005 [Caenorhabditis briggsae]|uniref:MATH domain-containing protein n=1 Tax=Caenorhabditis briggsae TaxID=6238 RepID=A0AAE9F8V9_CAEBR|nr:hypothetical protein L5515_009005 [Caenorhabditis briggsae]
MDTGDDVDAQQKEIRAMKRKFDEMSEKLQSVEESFSKISKNETSAISKQAPIEKSINSNVTSNQEKMAAESEKRFVVKEVFTDIAEFEEKQTNCSEDEEHFNMKWCIKLDRDGNNLGLFIYCTPIDYDKNWSIQTEILFKFVESDKSQITLTGIDPHDFHYFLEVLYGESAIDDNNVEGVLLLAVKYDASTAIRRCEEFLLEKSKKTLKKKLMMAVRYELENLKKICLDQIVKKEQIQSVIPSNIEDLNLEVMSKLLEKSLSFR